MKVSDLQDLVLKLSAKGAEMKATPAAFLAALVRCIFYYRVKTDTQIAEICNISTRTMTHNADQIEDLLDEVWASLPQLFDESSEEGCNVHHHRQSVVQLPTRSPKGKRENGRNVANCDTVLNKSLGQSEGDVANCDTFGVGLDEVDEMSGENLAKSRDVVPNVQPNGNAVLHDPQNSPVVAKRKARKGFPPNPLSYRGKRKCNSCMVPPNPPMGENAHTACDDDACSSLPAQSTHLSKSAQRALRSKKRDTPLRYPQAFEEFFENYPVHGDHAKESTRYRVMLMRWWRDCEDEGYTDEDIFSAYKKLSKRSQWRADDGAYIPSAWSFLASYVYLYPPSGSRSEYALARLATVDPALVEFCERYPKRTNPNSRAMIKAWRTCIKKEGHTPEEIRLCLEYFLKSDRWTEKGGRFIPQADVWLRNEGYNDILSFVRDAQLVPCGVEHPHEKLRVRDLESFNLFCDRYPRSTGNKLSSKRYLVWSAWIRLEYLGYEGKQLLAGLDKALASADFQKEDGRYIPKAEKFLSEERITRFVPKPEPPDMYWPI